MAIAKARTLLKFCVLRFSLLKDGDVGIGVFPEREEVLIRGAGFGFVGLKSVSAGESQVSQRAQ